MVTAFKEATDPAFKPGEIWVGVGDIRVEIISVVRDANARGHNCSEYEVTYYTNAARTTTHTKDAWNFQVRYCHESELSDKIIAELFQIAL